MNYLIKTHRPGTTYKGFNLFVLNRGRNTGRLIPNPCPNCWVINCDSQRTLDRLEFIIHSLHITKKWEAALIGSVIEYIRIGDFKKTLHAYVQILGYESKLDSQIASIQQAQKLLDKYTLMKENMDHLIKAMYIEFLRGK